MFSPIHESKTRGQGLGPLGILVAATLLVIFVSPPIFVENASAASRVTWFLSAAVLFLGGLLAAVKAENKHPELDFRYRLPRVAHGIVMVTAFAAVVLLSIIFANLQSTEGTGAATATIIIVAAEPFFLWLENFRLARGGLGNSDLQVMKVEAIQSLWFMYGVFVWLQVLLLNLIMSEEEKQQQQHKYLMQRHDKRHSGATVFFCSLFGILMATAAYSGWYEFDTSTTKCLLSVSCYQQNDLAIITAAGLKFIAIFGFLGGAVMMVSDYFQR
jgi:hypothetical protein